VLSRFPENKKMVKNIVMSAAVLAACCLTAPLSGQTQPAASPQTQTPSQPPAMPAPRTQVPTIVTPVAPPDVPVGTTGTKSVADTEHGTSILLLDRVQKVLDKAETKDGQAMLERGLLDEIRAEIAQVKASLEAANKR
jgi:hypothetical protein